jgi:ADP-ribose pyrophosphatase YjhB (NUDIX family)
MRRIFNHNNLKESKIINFSHKNEMYPQTISSCGCLFYKKNGKLLLIKYDDPEWNRYDDLGGQIDIEDDSIFTAMAREIAEETNNILSFKFINKLFEQNKIHLFYNEQSKYYCNIICVSDNFMENTDIFGDLEIHDNIKRSIKWYDYKKVKKMLSYRLLNNKSLINFLDKLFDVN